MITLKQLAHAMALERHLNFHRAARAENISQPAFSRSIRALETELGVPLFDRQRTVVTPTLFGQTVLERARTIYAEKEELLREIRLLKGIEAGNLTIAAGVYAAELSVSHAVGQIVHSYPKLSCRLRLTSWTQISGLVLSRSVDLGVGEIRNSDNTKELQIEPIGQHQLLFYCRREHPLVGATRPSKKDMDNYPLVTVRLPQRVAHVFPGKSFLDKETGDLIPSVEVDDSSAALNVVKQSNALGVATPVQIEPWLKSGEVQALPFAPPWLTLNYGFIYLRNRTLSPAASTFMQLVREIEGEVSRKNHKLVKTMLRQT